VSRGPEAAFWKRVRREWKGHAVRIEASDGVVDPGTPDTNLSINYRGGWVELKVWPDTLSPEQQAWHEDAIERGAYVMVLCEFSDGSVWIGDYEEYTIRVHDHAARRTKPRDRISLQAALDMIACALNRSAEKKSTNNK
jgi:hypothetical protein